MDFREQIKVYLNTSFKKTNENNTLYSGHSLVKFGEWSRRTGFTKIDTASFEGFAIRCPVIAIVETKIRESNITLTITGNNADYKEDETFQQVGRTIIKKLYKPGTTTTQTSWEVPRFTRTGATFLISGLGNQIFELTSIAADVTENEPCGGKISFYGLASEGSKILYYLGMFKLHNMIKEIINSIWIAPTTCPCCNGTGFINNGATDCPQCDTYGYSGFNATKGIQVAKGYDVRLTRDKFSSYPLTDAQYQKVWKFVNKCWTQKWWVTPTISEIKRLFAHFYNVDTDDIIITERYHFSMPHWWVSLPIEGSIGSPFDFGDRDLMKFIAESITPAGVNVFVGFYKDLEDEIWDDLLCRCIDTQQGNNLITNKTLYSSMEANYDNWFSRYRVWNGWCDCTDNFESGVIDIAWTPTGGISVYNANDIGRNWLKFTDSGLIWRNALVNNPTGVNELWVHPVDTDLDAGFLLTGIQFRFGSIIYKQSSTGFTNKSGVVLLPASTDCDYHLGWHYWVDGAKIRWRNYINRNLVDSGYMIVPPVVSPAKFMVGTSGVGNAFVDNYNERDNASSGFTAWQRLYPWGWGQEHIQDGIYEAIYNFLDDANGSNPDDWSVSETGGTVNIISGIDGHNKIIELDRDGTNNPIYTVNTISRTSGTVEFWWRFLVGGKSYQMMIGDNLLPVPTDYLLVLTGATNFSYQDGGGVQDTGVAYVINTWYHVKITFDTSGTWSFEIRNTADTLITSASGLSFVGSPVTMTDVAFVTGGASCVDGLYYVDAIGYSWDPNYQVGDNKIGHDLFEEYFHKNMFFEL